MTIDMTRDVGARAGLGALSGLDTGTDLDEQAAALGALAERVCVPPRDRDPLLWAAHEYLQAARLLIEAHADAPADQRHRLADAVAQSRSATASLHFALRERA